MSEIHDESALARDIEAGHTEADREEEDFVPPKGRTASAVVLGMSQSIDNSEGGVSKTFAAQIALAYGVGAAGVGILGAVSMYARMIFGPLWAVAADRYGRKRILIIVTGLWGLWTVATGFATSWPMLLALYSIALVGTVASEPILNGLLGSLYARSERGRAFGLVRGVSAALGFVLTPLIGQFGDNPQGWRYAMFAMGGMSILSGILILLVVKEPERVSADDSAELEAEMKADAGLFKLSDVPKLFRVPTLALMAPMLLFVTSLIMFQFQSLFWARELGYGVKAASYIATVQSVGMTISAFLGGFLGDFFQRRFGDRGRIMLFQIYAVCFAVVTFIAFQLPKIFDPDVTPGDGQQVTNSPSIAYYAMVFVLGLVFSWGFSGCVLPMVSSVAPKQLSATAFAVLFSLIQGFITATLTLIVGGIASRLHNLPLTLLWFVTIPYLINAVYWLVFYKVYPKDVALQRERTRLVEAGEF